MAKDPVEMWLRTINRSGVEVPVDEMERRHAYPSPSGTLRVRYNFMCCRERPLDLKVLGTE
eukprot:5507965-Pyramimonas_sp.AAC.1